MTTSAGSSGCKGSSAYPLFGIVVASMKQICSDIGIPGRGRYRITEKECDYK
ncbi:MAG: hypothetical protein GXY77_01745 [Fibrobacter sp.]|nr:hypothetical protein [Fibrobacter sp.]